MSGFRNDAQITRAVLTLLEPCGIGERGFWTEAGPTQPTVDLVEGRGCMLSSGEQVLLRVAMDLWNGLGRATIGDVLGLDGGNQRAVYGLLEAVSRGPRAVDEWIASRAKAPWAP